MLRVRLSLLGFIAITTACSDTAPSSDLDASEADAAHDVAHDISGDTGPDGSRTDASSTESCETLHVATLKVPFAPYQSTFSPTGHPSMAVCGMDYSTAEQLIGLTTERGMSVRLTVDARDPFDRAYFGYGLGQLGAYRGCDAGVLTDMLRCDDNPTSEVLEIDANLEPGTTTVAIQARDAEAETYTLSMAELTPVANGTCATATDMTPEADVTEHTFDGASNHTSDCMVGTARPVVWFRLSQPPRTRLRLDINQEVYQTFLLPDCASNVCLEPENTSDETRQVLVGVPKPYNDRTPFDLQVRFDALGPNVGCDEAVVLTPNTPFEVDLTTAGEGSYCNGSRPGVYHRLTVPAHHSAFFELAADGLLAFPGLALMSACGATECLSESWENISTPSFLNTSDEPVDIIAFVHGQAATVDGPTPARFTPVVSPMPENTTCADAIPVTIGTPVLGDTRLGGDPLACNVPAPGDENVSMLNLPSPLYYRVSVPPGDTLHASIVAARPTGNVGALMRTCTPSCLNPHAGSTYVPYDSAFIYTNSGSATEDLVIAVGHGDWTTGGPFELHTQLRNQPNNRVCANATPVEHGTLVPAEDPAAGLDDLSARCGPEGGGALYYRVTVPNDRELVVYADAPHWANSTFPPVVRLLESCAGACTDVEPVSDVRMPDPVRLAWHNRTGAPVDRIIAVSARGAAESPYDLLVMLREPPYSVERIAAACVPMDTAPIWNPPDPSWNESEALPFRVPFFGTEMTHMGPGRNGVVRLWNHAGESTNTSGPAPTEPLPTPYVPAGLIAAYWAPMTALLRIATVGTGSEERLVFEWSGAVTLTPTQTAQIQVQAHLSRTGLIELHPCQRANVEGHPAGQGATVGIQSSRGADLMAIGFDEPGLYEPSWGWRFTPR